MSRRHTIAAGARAAAIAAIVATAGTSCERPGGASAGGTAPEGPAWLEDVTAGSGITFRHSTGADGRFLFPEISAGGVGLLDYDGDGLLDVYLLQSGVLAGRRSAGNALYRNLGDWRFEDVTAAAGVGDTGYGMGCAAGDYDGDGDDDLYVTNLGANVLYRNEGNGTFTDVSEASGVDDPSWGSSAAFIDFDADGLLDLLVANYIHWSPGQELECKSLGGRRDYCSPKNYNTPARDTLYRNLGDGTFRDVTAETGMDQAFGNGFGIACADFDGNGALDVYVANDGSPNQLWLGDGAGRFADRALTLGCALNHYGWAEASMGVAAVDVEPDGDLDLFISHLHEETNTLYLNQNGRFEDATARLGLAAPSLGQTGFGLGFADLDQDGRIDLYVANGRVKLADPSFGTDDPYVEPNQLFRGTEGGRFDEIKPRGGTATPLLATSRAAAFGDLDGDGDVDIVVANKDAPPHVLRNVAGDGRSWVLFRARDRHGNDANGAMVGIEAGGRAQWRLVQRTYSYCATNDPRVHFGLDGSARVDTVTVRWLDGSEEQFGPFDAGLTHELREGAGTASR